MSNHETSHAEPYDDDDAYVSAEDDDFAPEAEEGAGDHASSASESEAEDGDTGRGGTLKKQRNPEKAEIGNIEQDEVEGLLQEAGTTKKRKRKGSHGSSGDDSGGEGGFVKTRSMAAAKKEEATKKPLASDTGADIDVDALWQSMNSSSLRPTAAPTTGVTTTPLPLKPSSFSTNAKAQDGSSSSQDLVPVTETYTFAGEIHTSTRLVPRSSAAATGKENGGDAGESPSTTTTTPATTTRQKLSPDTGLPLLRPLRRISPFDPNPTAQVRGLEKSTTSTTTNTSSSDPNNKTTMTSSATAQVTYTLSKSDVRSKKGPGGASKHKYNIPRVRQPAKLNVVDKSKLDWNAHVEATGAAEELEAAKKAKGAFLERRDFLERVEGRREDALAGLKGK